MLWRAWETEGGEAAGQCLPKRGSLSLGGDVREGEERGGGAEVAGGEILEGGEGGGGGRDVGSRGRVASIDDESW